MNITNTSDIAPIRITGDGTEHNAHERNDMVKEYALSHRETSSNVPDCVFREDECKRKITGLTGEIFHEFYYRKDELIAFCRSNSLATSGGKSELADRIAYFLDTGEVKASAPVRKKAPSTAPINENTRIEADLVCSEKHMAFFKEQMGRSFTFNVAFQKWLKENAGKTYKDAVDAYHQIKTGRTNGKTTIGKQFEYNLYIRDFFADNKGKSLADAITCWNYKKRLQGSKRYEKSDLTALGAQGDHEVGGDLIYADANRDVTACTEDLSERDAYFAATRTGHEKKQGIAKHIKRHQL